MTHSQKDFTRIKPKSSMRSRRWIKRMANESRQTDRGTEKSTWNMYYITPWWNQQKKYFKNMNCDTYVESRTEIKSWMCNNGKIISGQAYTFHPHSALNYDCFIATELHINQLDLAYLPLNFICACLRAHVCVCVCMCTCVCVHTYTHHQYFITSAYQKLSESNNKNLSCLPEAINWFQNSFSFLSYTPSNHILNFTTNANKEDKSWSKTIFQKICCPRKLLGIWWSNFLEPKVLGADPPLVTGKEQMNETVLLEFVILLRCQCPAYACTQHYAHNRPLI